MLQNVGVWRFRILFVDVPRFWRDFARGYLGLLCELQVEDWSFMGDVLNWSESGEVNFLRCAVGNAVKQAAVQAPNDFSQDVLGGHWGSSRDLVQGLV
jgi:hypothetical protein